MAAVIPQRLLRTQSASIIDAVAAGETFVVTRHGMPVAEIRAISQSVRTFVPRAEFAGGSARIDAAAFRADLDRVADQSLAE